MGTTEISDISLQEGSCTFTANVIGTQLLFSLPESGSQSAGDAAIVLENGVQYIPVYLQEALPTNVVSSYVINDSQQFAQLDETRQIILTEDQIVTLNQVTATDLQQGEFSPHFLSKPGASEEHSDASGLVDGRRAQIIVEKEDIAFGLSSIPPPPAPEIDVVDPPDNTCPQACDTCGLRFESRKLLKKHVLSHLHEKPYKCPHCPESFNHEYNYIPHMATHNKKDPFCPVCNKRFSRLAGLKAHILIHQCDDTVPCPECLEEFSTQKLLEAHRLEHKSGYVKPSLRLHCCPNCDEKFVTKAFLKEHIQEVHKLKIPKKVKRGKGGYVCEFCQKRFEKPSQLVRHRRTHTGEKPFKCAECGKGFGQKGSLQIHMLKHSGERPYACNYCASQFSQKGNLQAHIVRIHPEEKDDSRKLSCKFCSSVFRNVVALHNHMSRHHGVIHTSKNGKTITYELSNKDDTIIVNVTIDKDTSNKENEAKGEEEADDGITSVECQPQRAECDFEWKNASSDVINKCKFCSTVFKKRADLVKHLKFHADDRRRKCDFVCECNRRFPSQAILLSHIQSAHPENFEFPCDECSSHFASLGDLQKHRKSEHHAGFKCLKCNESFASSQELRNHEAEHENANAPPSPLPEQATTQEPTVPVTSSSSILGDIPLECAQLLLTADGTIEVIRDETGKTYVVDHLPKPHEDDPLASLEPKPAEEDVRLLQEVIEESTREEGDSSRKYKCDHCNLAFKQHSHWMMHLRIHTGEKPYSCETCNKSFASKSALTTHLGTHDVVPAFNCEDCGKAFSTSRSLKRHMELHVPGFSYSCSVCPRAYKTKVAWQKHLTTHMKLSQQEAEAQRKSDDKEMTRNRGVEELESLVGSRVHELPLPDDRVGEQRKDASAFHGDWNDLIESLEPPPQTPINDKGAQKYTLVDAPQQSSKISSTHTSRQQGSAAEVRLSDFGGKNQLFNSMSDQAFDGCVFLQNSRDIQASSNQVHSTGEPSVVAPAQPQANTHRCSLCDIGFDNLVELSIHKTSHLQEKWTTCASCDRVFTSLHDYQAHGRVCPPETSKNNRDKTTQDYVCVDLLPSSKLQKCNACDIHFFQPEDYVIHVNTHHGSYACKTCSTWFKHPEELKVHSQCHKEDKKKDLDNFREVDSEDSEASKVLQHAIGPEIVEVQVTNNDDASHRKSVLPRDRLELKRKRAVWRRQTIRPLTEEEQLAITKGSPSSISEKILQQTILCQISPEKKRKEIKQEPDTMENDLTQVLHPNQCKYCPKSFRKPSDLVRHLRVHTGERPYTCTSCNKSFSIKSTANSHVKIHRKERAYACHICHTNFAAIGSLKVHMRLHTGSKPFACELCPAKFRTSGHRKSHMFSHQRKEISKEKDKIYLPLSVDQDQSPPHSHLPALSPMKTVPTGSPPSPNSDFLSKPMNRSEDIEALVPSKKPAASNSQFLFSLDGALNVEAAPSSQQFFLKEVKGDDQTGTAAHFVVTMGEDINYSDNINDLLESVPHLNEDHEDRFKLDLDLEVTKEGLNDGVCETCTVCGKVFGSCLELVTHMKKEHFASSLLSCNVCKQTFRGKTDLEVHMLVHELDQLSCHACSLEFPDESALRKHKCTNEDSDMKTMPSSSLDLASVVHEFFSFPTL